MSPRDLGGVGAPCRLGGSGGGQVLAAGFAARDEAAWQCPRVCDWDWGFPSTVKAAQ